MNKKDKDIVEHTQPGYGIRAGASSISNDVYRCTRLCVAMPNVPVAVY